ncbi:hypothetical protein [Streptomyces sp. NPDC048473]|uniref:hypothetical protein n=1 Tax=Streptomyces sp. NPDC048473 TaxID=3365556 RepID=UPI0037153B43
MQSLAGASNPIFELQPGQVGHYVPYEGFSVEPGAHAMHLASDLGDAIDVEGNFLLGHLHGLHGHGQTLGLVTGAILAFSPRVI